MKKSLILGVVLSASLLMVSCGGKTKKHANKLCDCMKEVGIDDLSVSSMEDREFTRKMEKKMPSCAKETLEAMNKEMNSMNKDQKVAYTKSFLKDVIDTECATKLLELIPYDMMDMAVKRLD